MTRFVRFPVTWMAVGIVVLILIESLGYLGPGYTVLATAVAACALGVWAYVLIMRHMARRATPELAVRTLGRNLGIGLALGLGVMGLSFGAVWALGGYQVTVADLSGTERLRVLLIAFLAGLLPGIFEELMFRGFLLQSVEALSGTWVGLAVSSLVFGAAHLANPHATWWSAVAISLEAGLLIGAVFLATRSLYAAVGLHFAWNFLVSLVGIPVSGGEAQGLLSTTAVGPMWLTGGDFGIEASVVPVVCGTVVAVVALRVAARRRAENPLENP